LLFISICTILISGIGAIYETDLKKIIALSTLSQLGVIIMILSVGYLNLAFFHLLTHAVFKAMLFLCAGVIIHGIGGTQDIRSIGTILFISPAVSIRLSLANLALSGFPFLRGFYSKDIILEIIYVLNSRLILLPMVVIATLFTTIYSLRLRYYCLWRGGIESTIINYQDIGVILYPILFISICVVFMGSRLSWIMFPEPIFIHLVSGIKVLNVLLVFMAVFIFYIQFNKNWSSGLTGRIAHFFGTLWFLPLLTGGGTTIFLVNMKKYHLEMDQAWREEVRSQGVYNLITNPSLSLSSSATQILSPLLILLFFSIFIIFII